MDLRAVLKFWVRVPSGPLVSGSPAELGSLYVITTGLNNTIEKAIKIPRRSKHTYERLSVSLKGDDIDIFYIGNPKNIDLKKNEFPIGDTDYENMAFKKSHKGDHLLVTRVNEKGELKTYILSEEVNKYKFSMDYVHYDKAGNFMYCKELITCVGSNYSWLFHYITPK